MFFDGYDLYVAGPILGGASGRGEERTDDQCSVDLNRELANPVNQIGAQIIRSIRDLDLKVALQDLFPQDAEL